MTRQSIACAAIIAALLSACSGDSFERQAESAVRQHFLTEMHQMGARVGAGNVQDLRVENFRSGDCNDSDNRRTCSVSFQMSATIDGKREVMPEPIEGEAVFTKSDDQWLLISIE